jgi:multiple sugar transport system substrate-binding protein
MLREQREVFDEIIVKMRAGRMTRRTFIERAIAIGMSTTAAGALLDACGSSSSGGSGKTTTIVWESENDTSGTYSKIVDNYNKTNKDGIFVHWNNGPSSTDNLLTTYTTMLRARSHTIDVMNIDVTYPAEFGSNAWVVPIQDKWPASERANYLSGPVASCTYNGQIWAAPFRTDIGLIYYRTDIISTPPNTWDELTSMAQANAAKAKYGYVWQGAQYEGLVCDFVEVLYGYGGAILDPNNPKSVTVNSSEGQAALSKMVSWVGGISPTAVTDYTEEPARSTWQNGDSIFMRNWVYAYSLGNNPAQSKIAGKFDIHPMLYGGSNTVGHSCVGGWNLAINAFSPNPDASWKFVQYMLSSYAQNEGAIGASWTTTLKSVYTDASVLKAEPLFSKLSPVLQTAQPRPVSPRYPDVSAAIQLYVHQALLKQMSPTAALSTLQSKLQSLVG